MSSRASSREPEIAYLFTLYACSPAMSTIAVRDPGGYFDPFRGAHYKDAGDPEDLHAGVSRGAQGSRWRSPFPISISRGRANISTNCGSIIAAADAGEKTPKQAMDDTASRMGADHPPHGRAQPGGAVEVPEVDLSREVRDRLK